MSLGNILQMLRYTMKKVNPLQNHEFLKMEVGPQWTPTRVPIINPSEVHISNNNKNALIITLEYLTRMGLS